MARLLLLTSIMKKPKADPFATIDARALANVTGGYVAGAGGQMPPYQGESGSSSGSGHHHHHGGCGGSNNNNNNNGLSPITISWGGPSGTNGTAQVRNPGRYHPE